MSRSMTSPTASRLHYAWVVAGITFFTLLVAAGIRSTPGVLIVPLEQEFGWDRASVSLPLALNLALYGLCGPFAAAFMDRFGIRRMMTIALVLLAAGTGLSAWMSAAWHFHLLWGLVVGLGSGLTSSVLGAVVAARWFQAKRGVVVGVFTASGATGQLIFLPFLAQAVVAHGWQSAVWITAAAAVVVGVLTVWLMRDRPGDVGVAPYGAVEPHEDSGRAAGNPFAAAINGLKVGVRTRDFWLLAGSFFVCGATTNGLIGTHLIAACLEHGIPEVTAAGLLALIGVFDIIGTILSGWLSDRFDNRWLLFWYYGLRGLSLLFLPEALHASSLHLIVFIVFYGLDWVATVPPTVRLAQDRFGAHGSIVFGWVVAAHQLGAAAAAQGAGLMHAWTGGYTASFLAAGALCAIACLFVIRVRRNQQIAVDG